MSWETRVFFKLPPTEDGFIAPSLTNKHVAEVFASFTSTGVPPLPPNHPERRSDNYLVIGGKYGGFVGAKLRNHSNGTVSSKLEVKTCISVPVTKQEEETEEGTGCPPHTPIALPALTCWDKVSTKIHGSLDEKENVAALQNLIRLGGRGHTAVGSHAAENLVFNPETKQLVQIVLAKSRIQGWCTSSLVFEETDILVSGLNMPASTKQEPETWRSWAFEGGSCSSTLEKIAENWTAIFEKALSTMESATRTNATNANSLALMKGSFQVASYPEFVQFVYLDPLLPKTAIDDMTCKM